MKEFIYLLNFESTGKCYVGRTQNLQHRFKSHLSALKSGRHSNKRMQEDYNRHGGRITLKILEEVPVTRAWGHGTPEIKWMLRLKTYDPSIGYNDRDRAMVMRRRRSDT